MSELPAVLNPVTGELVDLRSAPTEVLAEAIVDLATQHEEMAEFKRAIEATLIERLDADATWTLRVGDPKGNAQFEIKAPSPEAGATVYLADRLEGELQGLIDDERITPEAASKACRRSITLTLGVPWNADPTRLAEEVLGASAIEVGGFEVTVISAAASVAPVAAGAKALRKVPGVGDILDRALAPDVAPPARRVRVTRKERPR